MVKSLAFLTHIAFAAAALIKRCDQEPQPEPGNGTRVFEAEDAILSGNTRVATEQSGYTGESLPSLV